MLTDKQFHRVRDGVTTWVEFAAETDEDWTRIAGKLYHRNRLPRCVTVADIKQELLFWAWTYMQKWTPSGGQPLEKFCTTAATKRAQRWLNKQRNSYRRADGAPSRIEQPIGDLMPDAVSDADFVDCVLYFEPVQEDIVSRREIGDQIIARAETQRDRQCIAAFIEAEGCVETASRRLYADTNRRRICRFHSIKPVRRAIRDAVHQTFA